MLDSKFVTNQIKKKRDYLNHQSQITGTGKIFKSQEKNFFSLSNLVENLIINQSFKIINELIDFDQELNKSS